MWILSIAQQKTPTKNDPKPKINCRKGKEDLINCCSALVLNCILIKNLCLMMDELSVCALRGAERKKTGQIHRDNLFDARHTRSIDQSKHQ